MRAFLETHRWYLLLLILIVALSYYTSLDNAYVSDDVPTIAKNELLGTWEYILERPLFFARTTLFNLVTILFEATPAHYRIINLFFHTGVVLLLYSFLAEVFGQRPAIISSLVYATHPLLTESVSWISGGIYTQYSFFLLLSFLLFRYFLNHQQRKYWYWSLIAFILALTTSEKAIILPLLIVVSEMSFGNLKNHWTYISPYFVISALKSLELYQQLDERLALVNTSPTPPGPSNPLVQIPVAVSSYLKLAIWPQKLTLYQSELKFTWGQFWLLAGITGTFLTTLILGFKKNKHVFFGFSWFIIALLPTLTPFGVSWIVAERYVYLSLIGLVYVLAWLTKLGLDKYNNEIIYTLATIVILALLMRTIVRNQDWQNEDTLWVATAKVSQNSPNARNNLGDVYSRHGDLPQAAQEFRKAIELQPNYAEAYHNLANTLHQLGNRAEAVNFYQAAVRLKPSLWQSYQNLATVYFELGDREQALNAIATAISINPSNPVLLTNYGIMLAQTGKLEEAKTAFRKALELNPQDQKALQGLNKLTQ